LQGHKIDALINSDAVSTLAVNRFADLAHFPEKLGDYEIGIAFPKGSDLASQFSEIIDRLRSDGTTDDLWAKWTAGDDGDKTVPDQDWPGENGTLTVAACESLEPVSYLVNGQMLGFDIETLLICAKELDYHLEFEPMEFSDVLSYIQSGKSDLGCGSILITDERREAMDFATTHENDLVLVTRIAEGAGTSSDESGSSWVDGIISSFHKTFVKDNRWTYIVGGLQTTAIITLCSGALGTAIGFMTTLLRRRGMRVANAFVNGFEGLMNRLPIVVVLLALYYVVFGSTDISGTVVSTIAFTLAFSATAGSIMWNAVQAVDAGQGEAARSLGLSKTQTMGKVILPQAVKNILPALGNEFVTIIKETSLASTFFVGDLMTAYLTVKGVTYLAFESLIIVGVIYFVLTFCLSKLIGVYERRLKQSD
jgi:polar amino acid transport system substrate-binding protein